MPGAVHILHYRPGVFAECAIGPARQTDAISSLIVNTIAAGSGTRSGLDQAAISADGKIWRAAAARRPQFSVTTPRDAAALQSSADEILIEVSAGAGRKLNCDSGAHVPSEPSAPELVQLMI